MISCCSKPWSKQKHRRKMPKVSIWNLTRRVFHILGNFSNHIDYWISSHGKPDIFCYNLIPLLTVRKKSSFCKIFYNCHIISWRIVKEAQCIKKMAKTTTNLDKLVRSLKVESIYNYSSKLKSKATEIFGMLKFINSRVWH